MLLLYKKFLILHKRHYFLYFVHPASTSTQEITVKLTRNHLPLFVTMLLMRGTLCYVIVKVAKSNEHQIAALFVAPTRHTLKPLLGTGATAGIVGCLVCHVRGPRLVGYE